MLTCADSPAQVERVMSTMTLGATLSRRARTFAANRMLDLAVVLWFLMFRRSATKLSRVARRMVI